MDKQQELDVRIDAAMLWRNPPASEEEAALRAQMEKRVEAMGRRLEHSVKSIIETWIRGTP